LPPGVGAAPGIEKSLALATENTVLAIYPSKHGLSYGLTAESGMSSP
jgi:hypothetical protein